MERPAKFWTILHKVVIFMQMKNALEIILHDDIQRIFDNFAASFGISIVFYSVDGRILKRGLNSSESPFCALIQDQLFSREKCLFMDEQMCRQCTRSRKLVSYRCHAGVEEAVTPFYVADQLVGYAMIGQFRTSDTIDPTVLTVAKKKGLADELKNSFQQLPFFSREKADSILGLFAVLTDYIITKEIVSVKGERMAGRVLAYIEEHLHENIRIANAARALGQSTSGISHQLKRVTGKPFTQHLNEARIRRAEEYLCQSPESSIQEIAEKTGFNDSFYFSRVYKKIRGTPPSHYRKSFQKLNTLCKSETR
jgi:AraC-like DNA-binding protein/ligand-binding sensor protein